MKEFKHILSQFQLEDEIQSVTPFGDGHINDTYILLSQQNKYILQRINHRVFLKPDEVMLNIKNVTEHLRKKIIASGGDPKRETLNFINSTDGKNFIRIEDNFYRLYHFVDGACTYQTIENPDVFYHSAKAFGRFQLLLADFPAEKLHETIVNFHNTKDRYDKLMVAVEENLAGRKDQVLSEIEFVKQRKNDTSVIVDYLEQGKLPLRVTHNDTKLNNVLIDEKTGTGVCVLDLDTVMPSTLLYDFGDAIRFGANTAQEDEQDLSKVDLDVDLFSVYAQGFIEELRNVLTDLEVKLLPFSAKIMTLECGIRFLTDYLNGDTYFRIHREHHNLDRARCQFKLVEAMEEKMDVMNSIVSDLMKKELVV